MDEGVFQKRLAKILKKEQFYNLIREESLEKAKIEFSKLNKVKGRRTYSANDILKYKYLEAIKTISEILGNKLTVILDSGKENISMNRKESLNPDLILFDYETHSYIIVELKVSANAERQAVTEILAYQFEIKNYLPGISNYNMPLIVISKDFRPLLLHSIAGALMQNIPILCLKPVNSKDILFDIVDCDVWTQIDYSTVGKASFFGYTFCLYPSKKKAYTDDEMKRLLMLGSDLIYNKAVLSGSQGIAIAWKYKESDGIKEKDYYIANYCVSIFYLNPFSFFVDVHNEIQTEVAKHMKTVSNECCIVHMGDVFYATDFTDYLNQYFQVSREGFMRLEDFLNDASMMERDVIGCDSWGEFGNIIKSNYLNNVITLENTEVFMPGYKEPENFMKLLCLSFNEFLSFDNMFDYFIYGKESAYFYNCSNDGSYRYIRYMVSKDVFNKKHNLGISIGDEEKRLIDIGYSDGIYYEFLDIDDIDTEKFLKSDFATLCSECIGRYIKLIEGGEVKATKEITCFLLDYIDGLDENECNIISEKINITILLDLLQKTTPQDWIDIYLNLGETLINNRYYI